MCQKQTSTGIMIVVALNVASFPVSQLQFLRCLQSVFCTANDVKTGVERLGIGGLGMRLGWRPWNEAGVEAWE